MYSAFTSYLLYLPDCEVSLHAAWEQKKLVAVFLLLTAADAGYACPDRCPLRKKKLNLLVATGSVLVEDVLMATSSYLHINISSSNCSDKIKLWGLRRRKTQSHLHFAPSTRRESRATNPKRDLTCISRLDTHDLRRGSTFVMLGRTTPALRDKRRSRGFADVRCEDVDVQMSRWAKFLLSHRAHG